MILSPGATALSLAAPPRHWRFQASTAPSGRTPSTRRALSCSRCDTLRPKSAPSALRIVKLNWRKLCDCGVCCPGVCCCGRGGEDSEGVDDKELTSDSGVRCGVWVPSASARENGAAPAAVAARPPGRGAKPSCGCGEARDGNAGTSGKAFAAEASAPMELQEDASDTPVNGGTGVQATLGGVNNSDGGSELFPPTRPPRTWKRAASEEITCLRRSFSVSRAFCLSVIRCTSSASFPDFSLCFSSMLVMACCPRRHNSSALSETFASTSAKTCSLTA
mmetsp:Transcript_32730/g.90311  ORF Transcript_32730/g.90311 Transcript_32730/m.90311 type:complete len:277 (+) Transcript_32730:554-1384(+)